MQCNTLKSSAVHRTRSSSVKEAAEADLLASDRLLFQFVDCQEFVTIKSLIVVIVIWSSVADSCTAHIDFWMGELQIPSTQPLPHLHVLLNVDTHTQ